MPSIMSYTDKELEHQSFDEEKSDILLLQEISNHSVPCPKVSREDSLLVLEEPKLSKKA